MKQLWITFAYLLPNWNGIEYICHIHNPCKAATSHLVTSTSEWKNRWIQTGLMVMESQHSILLLETLWIYMMWCGDGICYVNCDGNNWHFYANLSLGVLLVQDGDSAHIGNMRKPEQSNYTKLTVTKSMGSSYQLLRHWWSYMSGE